MRGDVSILAASLVASMAGTVAPTEVRAQNGACHPSYVGWCVPMGRDDVDCLGGTGNGPNYVGRVIVVAYDEFRLDNDGDGIGCDNSPTGPLWPR
jgi:hypothetical protein